MIDDEAGQDEEEIDPEIAHLKRPYVQMLATEVVACLVRMVTDDSQSGEAPARLEGLDRFQPGHLRALTGGSRRSKDNAALTPPRHKAVEPVLGTVLSNG